MVTLHTMNSTPLVLTGASLFVMLIVFSLVGSMFGFLAGQMSGEQKQIGLLNEKRKGHKQFALEELPGEIFVGPTSLIEAIKVRVKKSDQANLAITRANTQFLARKEEKRINRFLRMKNGEEAA